MSNDRCQEILKRLDERCETELMPDDLMNMLEQELAKPAEEMDTDLVEELLELIGAEMPPEGAEENTWSKIEEQMSRPKPSVVLKIAKRVLAAAAVIVVLFFASFGTAKAFKWTFLLKLLAPVAETFGIYSDNNLPGQESAAHIPYTDETTGETQLQYATLADMPETYQGHRVLPVWLPERFTFLQGSLYDDGQAAVITAAYTGGEDFFNLTTTILASEADVSSYEFERSLDEPMESTINGYPVTYYHNTASKRLAVSWITDNACHMAIGYITQEELSKIVGALIEYQRSAY